VNTCACVFVSQLAVRGLWHDTHTYIPPRDTHTHTHAHTSTHPHPNSHIHTRAQHDTHTYIPPCDTHTRTHIHPPTPTLPYTHTRTTHTHPPTHTQIQIHIPAATVAASSVALRSASSSAAFLSSLILRARSSRSFFLRRSSCFTCHYRGNILKHCSNHYSNRALIALPDPLHCSNRGVNCSDCPFLRKSTAHDLKVQVCTITII